MRRVELYGTLGDACAAERTLAEMLRAGMTGVRLNLSHATLLESGERLSAFRRAAEGCMPTPRLVIDLQGPEVRVGRLAAPLPLKEGETVLLGGDGIPAPEAAVASLRPGERILLDDGALLLEAMAAEGRGVRCRVLRGGTLQSRKSLAVEGHAADGPALTQEDRENLANAKRFGVTDVLQPFVRGASDVEAVREALAENGLSSVRIMAKIENRRGLEKLDEIIAAADEICIARGDLGNAVPLWELPGVQKDIARRCRTVGKPFCVATQLLWSMQERAVPTRAEVSDIYNAVLDGAAGLMLTGETAVGRHPVEAIRYLARTAAQALKE